SFAREILLARCWPGVSRQVQIRCPTQTPPPAVLRARRTPTRLRWAILFSPILRRPRHLHRRCAPLDAWRVPLMSLPVLPDGASLPPEHRSTSCNNSKIHALARLLKHDGSGDEQFRLCSRIVLGIRRTFGRRHVLARFDETTKLFIGNGVSINPEAIHCYLVRRCFFRIVLVRSHEKSAAKNPHHFSNGGSPD